MATFPIFSLRPLNLLPSIHQMSVLRWGEHNSPVVVSIALLVHIVIPPVLPSCSASTGNSTISDLCKMAHGEERHSGNIKHAVSAHQIVPVLGRTLLILAATPTPVVLRERERTYWGVSWQGSFPIWKHIARTAILATVPGDLNLWPGPRRPFCPKDQCIREEVWSFFLFRTGQGLEKVHLSPPWKDVTMINAARWRQNVCVCVGVCLESNVPIFENVCPSLRVA